jgi:hypothetical protein
VNASDAIHASVKADEHLLALRRGQMAPARGHLLASLGADRLEAVLYERDELRAHAAAENTCDPCLSADHDNCSGGPIAPGCSCTDCELGIPEAAADTSVPREVQAELAGTR